MATQEIEKRGRGRPRTEATPVLVRFHPDDLAVVDKWRARLESKIGKPTSRPEAIRAMVRSSFRRMGEDVGEVMVRD